MGLGLHAAQARMVWLESGDLRGTLETIMAKEDLKEFFRKKKLRSRGNVNWAAKKRAWLKSVDQLYETVEKEYLAGPIREGIVSVSRSPKTIVEDMIGKYEIPELVIKVGTEEAVFSPKGRNVVGASGRIDLKGDMGEKTLVLQPGNRWGIVATRTPTLRVVPLDEKSLLDALKDIMRP